MPWQTKQVNFNPDTKTKYFLTPTQKPSQFRSRHWTQVLMLRHEKQVNFDPHSNINSISMPRLKNRVNFDSDIYNTLFSTATQKPAQSRCLHWNQISLDYPRDIQVQFDAQIETKRFPARIPKTSQFRPTKKIKSIDPHTKKSHFRPAHK